MDYIYNSIRNIVFFVLLCEFISCLTNNKKYKKYINLLTGLLFVLLIIAPILSFTNNTSYLEDVFMREYIMYDAAGSDYDFNAAADERDEAILTEYKAYLTTQMGELLGRYGYNIEKISFDIRSDTSKSDYGVIDYISAVVYKSDFSEADDTKSNTRIQIEKILIDGGSERNQIADTPSPDEIMLKNLISDFYHLNIDNINITIWEEQNGG